MYEIDSRLEALHKAGTPIRVSLIGAGQMGKDIVAQISEMKGISCDIIVDLNTLQHPTIRMFQIQSTILITIWRSASPRRMYVKLQA